MCLPNAGLAFKFPPPAEFSRDRLCFTTGFSFAKIVALFSHCASLSSLSPIPSLIAGKSLGTLIEPALEVRECDPRCKREDNRFSLVLEVVDFAEALEEVRKREKRFFSWEVLRWAFCWSSANVGGVMSSCVLVSVRMKVN